MVGAGKGRKREQKQRDEEGIRDAARAGEATGVEARAPAARALVARASEATAPKGLVIKIRPRNPRAYNLHFSGGDVFLGTAVRTGYEQGTN